MRLHEDKEKNGTRAEPYGVYQGGGKTHSRTCTKQLQTQETPEGKASQEQGEDKISNEQLAFSKVK